MKLQKTKLKNGLTILHESRPIPVVSLSISNPFGASSETSDIKGIAHVMEHLVFTGTKTRTHEDISREIEKKGGILNAFTSHDVTSFFFKLPSEHIFAGLDILTDILNNPAFNPEKFEKEKKVILEEIKMYHDIPQRHVLDQIEANLYGKPFGESVIGSVKTVSALNRDFVFNYFKKNYNPKNFIVTIVGNADFDKVCAYIEKNFQPREFKSALLKKSRDIQLSCTKSPNLSSETRKINNFKEESSTIPQKMKKINKETTEERQGIDQAHFVFALHAPLFSDKEYTHLELLDAYLADGMSSRLFLEIREKRGLAYAVKSSLNTEKNYSYYSVYVGTTKQAIPEVKELIIQEFKLATEKMTEKDLQEAKERLIGLKKVQSEESSNVMNELMFSELTTKAEDYYKHEEKIKQVTLSQVKAIAQIKNYSIATIVPK